MAQFQDPRARIVQSMLTRHRLSYRWLADRIGSNHMSVRRWVLGEAKPHRDRVFADMIETLSGYEKDVSGPHGIAVNRVGVRTIPLYTSISAGTPASFEGDVEPLDIVDTGTTNDQWARIVSGMSMSPLLEPGDIAVFEARPHEPGHVVHAFSGGEDVVKIFRPGPELAPANLDYETLDARQYSIRGVCIMRIRKGPHDEKTTTEYPHGMRHRS